MRLYKQNDISKKVILYMVDAEDHITPKTGLTLSVRVSRNGSSFTAGLGTVTELEDGLYSYALAEIDIATLGPIVVKATAPGADQCVVEGRVVAFDPDDQAGLGLFRLDTTITSRLAAADVPDHFSSLAITETTGKVTVDNVDDCKADVSGLATSAEIAACQTTAEAIKTQTDKMDFTGGGSMLKSESTNMRGTDGAYTGTPPTTGEIAAALKASTGWTAGNTMTLAEVVKILAAWSAGKWRDKDGAAGTYQVLDPDDGTTVICEITPSETTPHKTVTIL